MNKEYECEYCSSQLDDTDSEGFSGGDRTEACSVVRNLAMKNTEIDQY